MSRLLLLLLTLAVFGGQLAGVQRGYMCGDHHTTEQGCTEHDEHTPDIEPFQGEKHAADRLTAPLVVWMPLHPAHQMPRPRTTDHARSENCRAGPLWPPRLVRSITLMI